MNFHFDFFFSIDQNEESQLNNVAVNVDDNEKEHYHNHNTEESNH